jgi:hypothetical protein
MGYRKVIADWQKRPTAKIRKAVLAHKEMRYMSGVTKNSDLHNSENAEFEVLVYIK